MSGSSAGTGALRSVSACSRDIATGYSCLIQKREENPTVIVDYLCRRAQEQVTFTVS